MKKAILTTPVLMVFFIRPEPFQQVFNAVKAARPAQLFLFQDGAREGNPTDEANRLACQKVLAGIDWECDVKTFYPKVNYGVDASVYAAIQWAFSKTNRLIILEDDIVASPSFFKYCERLLERYKDDNDIAMIGGMNHLGTYKPDESSYLFAQSCAIWGWATWKRFFDEWERTLDCTKDPEKVEQVRKQLPKSAFVQQMEKARRVREEALKNERAASFEASATFARLMHNQYAIVPTKNLVTNIGIGQDTFHAADDLKKLSKVTQALFFMPRHELKFPLTEPDKKEQDAEYNRRINRLMSPPLLIGFLRKVESRIRRLVFK